MHSARPIAPVIPVNQRNIAFRPIGLDAARIVDGPWAQWQHDNRNVTMAHSFEWLERDGTIDNLRRLDPQAGDDRPRRGLWFTDSDLYKALEAVAWDSALEQSNERDALIADLAGIIGRAQQPDGYVNSFVEGGLDVRWDNLVKSHELYCMGHLIQAGIADRRATGRSELFTIAIKAADVIVEDFGGLRRDDTDGHEEIEMALVELYRETGERKYLEMAEQFVDVRGHGVLDASLHFDSAYYQDAIPVRDETTVTGHAVRAIYLLAGVVDLYLETGEKALLDAALEQWSSMTATKTYLTGAVGSRFAGEAFGDSYELPPDLAYGETCATIGNMMLSWRLLLATGQSRFADAFERGLYNLFAASTSIERTAFFYNNPAQRRAPYPAAPTDTRPLRADAPGTRPTWFECACCPPNIMRTIATLPAYLASNDDSGVQLHQFVAADLVFELGAGAVSLSVQTQYPLDGRVAITVTEAPDNPFTLSVRRPDWADALGVAINGGSVDVDATDAGYVPITRTWEAGDVLVIDIPMHPRLTVAHPAVDAVRGTVAIERGPVVYAFESVDQADDVDLNRVELLAERPLAERLGDVEGQETVLITAAGYLRDDTSWTGTGWHSRADAPPVDGRPVELVAIPYSLWANRGPSVMRIFVPEHR